MATRNTKRTGGAPRGNTNARRDAESITETISIRLTPNELATYKSLARYRGQHFSEMVRELCNAALLQAVTRGGWQPPAQKGVKGD